MAREEMVSFRVEPETMEALEAHKNDYRLSKSQAARQLLISELIERGYLEDRGNQNRRPFGVLELAINGSYLFALVIFGAAIAKMVLTIIPFSTIELPSFATLVSLAIVSLGVFMTAWVLRNPKQATENLRRSYLKYRRRLEV